MIFVGIDWSEAHHDVCVMNAEGRVLAKRTGLLRRRLVGDTAGCADLLVGNGLGPALPPGLGAW